MFDECRRLSDDELLFIPGEEANVYLGLARARPARRATGSTSSPGRSTGR